MTAHQSAEILRRLEDIERDVKAMRVEMAETRGAYRLAKFIIAFLGVSGLGAVTAWMSGQGK